jgi:uncharacterized protein YbcI
MTAGPAASLPQGLTVRGSRPERLGESERMSRLVTRVRAIGQAAKSELAVLFDYGRRCATVGHGTGPATGATLLAYDLEPRSGAGMSAGSAEGSHLGRGAECSYCCGRDLPSLLSLAWRPQRRGEEGPAMTEVEGRSHGGKMSAAISNAAVRVLSDYTGRGPTKAKTTINRDSVMIVFGDVLTKGERTLVENGDRDAVLQMRKRFQHAMRGELVAVVESHTERSVIAFMSDNHVDPDLAAEVFILEPLPDEPLPDDDQAKQEVLT